MSTPDASASGFTAADLYGSWTGTYTPAASPAPILVTKSGTSPYSPAPGFFSPLQLTVTFSPSNQFGFGFAYASAALAPGIGASLPTRQLAGGLSGDTVTWTVNQFETLPDATVLETDQIQYTGTLQRDPSGQLTLSGRWSTTPLLQALPAGAPFDLVLSDATFTLQPLTPPAPLPASGGADPTFAGGGDVSLPFAAEASAVAGDGKVLVAGSQPGPSAGSTQAVLERLAGDGTLDTQFGTNGTVTDQATAGSAYYGAMAQPDGKVVVCGSSGGALLVARYNPSGAPDATFGTAGRVTVAAGASSAAADATAYDLALGPNGSIVVVGSAGGQFLVDRLGADGSPDAGFNAGQPLLFGAPSDSVLGRVVLAGDGGIIAAGATGGAVTVVRVTAAGSLDTGFGTEGLVTLNQLTAPDLLAGQPDRTEGLALDSQGRILVANRTAGGDFGTVRLTAAGALDAAFGTRGLVTTDLGGDDDADQVAVQPDGQILVSGTTTTSGAGGAAPVTQEAVAALLDDGSPDTTFGTSGRVVLTAAPSPSAVRGAQRASASPSPAGGDRPQAEGLGAIFLRVFGSLEQDRLLVGIGRQSADGDSSSLRRIIASAPSSPSATTPLPTGTLGATVKGTLPSSVVGGARAKASVVVTAVNPTASSVRGPFTLTLYVSPAASLTGATPVATAKGTLSLKPGKSRSVKVRIATFPSLPKATYQLLAVLAAPDGTSTGAAGPSLMIAPAFVSLRLGGVQPTPSTAPAGKKVTLSLTLQNQGNQSAAGSAPLTVFASPQAGGTAQTLASVRLRVNLKPGAAKSYRVRLSLPRAFPAGTYALTASLAVAALGDATASDGTAISSVPLVVT